MAIHPNIKHHAILAGIRKCYAGQLNLLAEIESVDDLARVVTTIFGPVPAMEVDAFGKSLANAFRELKSAYVNVLVRDVINCWSKVRLCSTCQSFAAASVCHWRGFDRVLCMRHPTCTHRCRHMMC